MAGSAAVVEVTGVEVEVTVGEDVVGDVTVTVVGEVIVPELVEVTGTGVGEVW